jgi:hypothetical protein
MKKLLVLSVGLIVAVLSSRAAEPGAATDHPGFKTTPLLPGSKWHVHDSDRPEAPVVSTGKCITTAPPADAIVLFDGKDLTKWQDGKGSASGWKVENGYMEVPPKKTPGGGDIITKQAFGDVHLHLEWCAPNPPKGNDQARGNSGVFFMGRYEVQVLDCYKNPTYADGAAAAVYGQTPPSANACLPPGEWQSYDITFLAPQFKDGKLVKPAYVTVVHNGVTVQDHTQILGAMAYKAIPKYTPHVEKLPLKLQDHTNPVRYRNIWVRELKAAE